MRKLRGKKGVAMAKEQPDVALKAIGDPKGPLLTVICTFSQALWQVTLLAINGGRQACGTGPERHVKDSKGNAFFMKFKEIAAGPGSGWVEYYWPKPGAKEDSSQEDLI